ncbi:MAG: hypothetical protein ABR585_12795 [Gemmatimonadaceae bacterium]|nr:hypothetical protein [Actinomycetota bacterium]
MTRIYGDNEFYVAHNAWMEETYDPDAPIGYWPDDETIAFYQVEVDRLEDLGHA